MEALIGTILGFLVVMAAGCAPYYLRSRNTIGGIQDN